MDKVIDYFSGYQNVGEDYEDKQRPRAPETYSGATDAQFERAIQVADEAKPIVDKLYSEDVATPPSPPINPANTLASGVGADSHLDTVKDGKSFSFYGSKVREVDQNTGKTIWRDATSGKVIDTPESEKIAQGEKDAAGLWSKRAEFNRRTLEERKRMQGQRNGLLADTVRETIEQLNNGAGEIRSLKNGRRYRIVMFKNDNEDNPVTRLNKQNMEMGREGRMSSISASVEVDKDGKAIGKPILKYGVSKDGGGTVFRNLSIHDVMDRWVKARQDSTGASELETRRAAVQAFGGRANLFGENPNGWDIAQTAQEKAEEDRRRFDEELKIKENELKLKQETAQIEKGLAERKLTAAEEQFEKTLNLEERKLLSNERTQMAQMLYEAQKKGEPMTIFEFVKSMPSHLSDALVGPITVLNEDGTPKIDEMTGKPLTKPRTDEEAKRNVIDFYNSLVGVSNAMRGGGYLGGNQQRAISLFSPPGSDASAAGNPPLNSTGNTNITLDGVRAEQAHRAAEAEAAKKNAEGKTQAGAPVQPQTPTDAPASTARAQELKEKMNGKGVKKGVTSKDLREEAALKKREQDISNAGANENIAMHYDSIEPSTMEKLRAAIPEMSNSDLYSGKYDKQILALAKRLGDESTPVVHSQIENFRIEKMNENKRDDIQRIREEAERLGIREGWTQEEIDRLIKRNIDRRYGNNAQRITAMLNSPLR